MRWWVMPTRAGTLHGCVGRRVPSPWKYVYIRSAKLTQISTMLWRQRCIITPTCHDICYPIILGRFGWQSSLQTKYWKNTWHGNGAPGAFFTDNKVHEALSTAHGRPHRICVVCWPNPRSTWNHARMYQNWARIGPMLAASGLFWPGSGTLWNIYRACSWPGICIFIGLHQYIIEDVPSSRHIRNGLLRIFRVLTYTVKLNVQNGNRIQPISLIRAEHKLYCN